MPDTATAPTMTAAQLRAAGTRLLGFYLGGGGAKVDALADPSHLLTRHDNGFLLAPALDTAAGGPVAGTVDDTASLFLTNPDSAYGLSIGVMGSGASWLQSQRRDGNASLYSLLLNPLGGNVGIGAIAPTERLEVGSGNVLLPFNNGNHGALVAYTSSDNFVAGIVTIPRYSLKWAMPSGAGSPVALLSSFGGIRFYTSDVEQLRIGQDGHILFGGNGTQNLGGPSNRGGTAYFATGTINTCDVRFKTFRTDRQLREAEHAAALELFDAFGFYQFNDAIEEKGADGARWHFGPAAQEAYAIWADHGLCDPLIENDKGELIPPPGAVPPAFMCFDLIEEETALVTEGWRPSALLGPDGQPVMVKCAEGEEATEQRPTGETIVTREAGHIFGVRIDQLHSIMLAALNAERKAQAAQIAELAARIDADAA